MLNLNLSNNIIEYQLVLFTIFLYHFDIVISEIKIHLDLSEVYLELYCLLELI